MDKLSYSKLISLTPVPKKNEIWSFKKKVKEAVEEYLNRQDWRQLENSNCSYSFSHLNSHLSQLCLAEYALSTYPKKIADLHRTGWIYIHNLGAGSCLAPYCQGLDLGLLIWKGLRCDGLNISASVPAKHFNSVINQIVNFLTIFAQERSGAVSLSSIDVYLAPFIKEDEEYYRKLLDLNDLQARRLVKAEVKQGIQNLIWHLNYPNRTGGQSIFSNVSLDLNLQESGLANRKVIHAGEQKGYRYRDLQEYVDLFNEIFLQVLLEGDADRRPFTFPIITVNITKNGRKTTIEDLLAEVNLKYGQTYFQNCVNGKMYQKELRVGDVHSMCFSGDTKVRIFDEKDLIIKEERLDVLYNSGKEEYYVETILGFRKANVIQVKTNTCVEVEMENGDIFKMTEDHICLTAKGMCLAKHLEENDFMYYMNRGNHYAVWMNADGIDYKDYKNMWDSVYDFLQKTCQLVKVKKVRHISYSDLEPFYCFRMKGDPPIFTLANGLVTHNCCRLQLDKTQIYNKVGGLFSYGVNTGSIEVVSLNLPRYAYVVHDEDDFYALVDYMMEFAKEVLLWKKKKVKENIQKGLLPITKEYLGDNLETYFLTIGYCGLHEALINLGYQDGLANEDNWRIAEKILEHIVKKTLEFQQRTGELFNFEAVPGESMCGKLASLDRKYFKDIYTSGTEESPYYTNSCMPPVEKQSDIIFLLRCMDTLQRYHTGGSVTHFYINEKLDKKAFWQFVETVCKTSIPYFTFTRILCYCPKCGKINLEDIKQEKCRMCGSQVEILTRVVGYYRPLGNWNKFKKREFYDREGW